MKSAANTISSIPSDALGYYLSQHVKEAEKPVLCLCLDEPSMEKLAASYHFFSGQKALLIPAWDCLPYDRISPSSTQVAGRISGLAALAEGKGASRLVLTTVNSVLQRMVPRRLIATTCLLVNKGDEILHDDVISFLVVNGYNRAAKAMEPGDFAVRGGIIDFFPSGYTDAVRVEFFGDIVESIRFFDPLTQVSKAAIDKVEIFAASEVPLTDDSVSRFRMQYIAHFGAFARQDALYESISEKRKFTGYEHWLPLFYEKLETVFDYLPESEILLEHQLVPAAISRLEQIKELYESRVINSKAAKGEEYRPLLPEELYLSAREFEACLENAVQVSPFEVASGKCQVASEFAEKCIMSSRPHDALASSNPSHWPLVTSHLKGIKNIIACFSSGSRSRIKKMLEEHEISCKEVESFAQCENVVSLAILPLEKGFFDDKINLLTEQDIFGERIARAGKRKKKAEDFLSEAANFTAGDLLVHRDHGIGRFEGLINITAGGAPHDCLKLVYQDNDRLFVPVENIEVLTNFGADGDDVRLDKLGAASWQARKARLKERIKIAADELMRIAAERSLKHAPQIAPATGTYEEFCARFPYAETEDQDRAIEDVLADLSSGKPTERLICGDVGFGKTEVAMRAAFVVVASDKWQVTSEDSENTNNEQRTTNNYTSHWPLATGHSKRQVALICPTTILARQHYRNFAERFRGLPYSIKQLSRFVTAKEAKETKAALANGGVDIIIGTHALLAKDVKFKNLALVIIDEEQHFGVKQKEKLKELKSDVHVISLSATPIPRTMQMALSGIRELSLITTPPVDRLAVRTFVMPFDAVIIREAVMRERFRGGKTFYVAPRIKDLDEITVKLKEIVPEVKVCMAHGQMKPNALEEVMGDFYDGKYDVLVSTNIVESGLDVPNANTIVIHRADMFGLSQLYQLRGRVGRGKQRAYAYLTTPYHRQLGGNAERRLEVMHSLDALGAGFAVASSDMDIRGFGNLVGEEQSGQIKEVGVELYQQMLEEAVVAAKAATVASDQMPVASEKAAYSPQINLGIAVLIPETYVADLNLRLGLYRRAGNLKSVEEIEAFAVEMVDRFGEMPEETQNLLTVMKIKLTCRKVGVEKVDAGPKGAVISFLDNKFENPDKLLDFLAKNSQHVKVRPDQKLVFSFDGEIPAIRVKKVEKALEKLAGLIAL